MTTVIPNVKTFYKGQTIYKEGQPGSVAYMIRKGAVVCYRTEGNRKIPVTRHKQGQIFGEMALLAEGRHTHSAEAMEYTEVMVLTEQFLQNLLEQCPKTIQYLTRLMIKRLQETEESLRPDQKGTFLSVCRIMELAYEKHLALGCTDARKDPNYKYGLSVNDLSRRIKDILLVSQVEIDRILEQLHNLKIVEVAGIKGKKAFTERYLRITNPDTFYQVASNLYRELKNSDDASGADMEYVDIFDFAEAIDAKPEILYKKMANGEVPETLFFFHKRFALAWAEKQEKGFFNKVKRKKKKIEDLEDVNDIIFVDNATLKKVFAKLGYYKLGVLMSVAEEEARKRIEGNLARKIAAVVQEEAAQREHVDEAESEDIQDELIALIKDLKGVK